VRLTALDAYEQMIGLNLADVAVDGCTTKAPCGGECAGRSPVDRTGRGPQVMAALRNTATNLARLAGQDNIAGAQRTAAWHPTAITDTLNAA
jgi:hypothetical protein